jgi:hypothetical protein
MPGPSGGTMLASVVQLAPPGPLIQMFGTLNPLAFWNTRRTLASAVTRESKRKVMLVLVQPPTARPQFEALNSSCWTAPSVNAPRPPVRLAFCSQAEPAPV